MKNIARKYTVLKTISETHLSKVFKVKNLNGKLFAAKVIQKDSDSLYGIYDQEVKLLKQFQHENIVKIVDHGEDTENNVFFIITEFIDGQTIDQYFPNGIYDENDFVTFLEIARQILSALSYVHKADHLHRDIKPSNIMVDFEGKPYLLDFGITQILDTITTTKEDFFATQVYAAPEQLKADKLSAKTDIYQLGITFLQLVTDDDAFDQFKHKTCSLSDFIEQINLSYGLSDLKSDVKSVIQQMTEENPDNRIDGNALEIELRRLQRRLGAKDTFQICLTLKTADQIKQETEEIDDDFEVKQFLEDALNDDSVYVKFEPDRSDRDQFIFVTSKFTLKTNVSQDHSHFFAFAFFSTPYEGVLRDGISLNDKFHISIRQPEIGYHFSNTEELKAKLISEDKKRQKKRQEAKKEKDFLDKSEVLLKEEINHQLNKLKFSVQYEDYTIKRARKQITFYLDSATPQITALEIKPGKFDEFVNTLQKSPFLAGQSISTSASLEDIVRVLNQLIQNERFYLSQRKAIDNAIKDKKFAARLTDYSDKSPEDIRKLNYQILFKVFPQYLKETKPEVQFPKELELECGIYHNQQAEDSLLSGEISKIDKVNFRISVKFARLTEADEEKIPKPGLLKSDFTVKDIVLNRQKNALNALKNGNSTIDNLLSKIAKVKLLEPKQALPEITEWLNSELDQNQQEAVRKILALHRGEFLAIQGPPGTGKTTVITETILQILKTEPRARILITSQSNQAVDNVLERIVKFPDIRVARFVRGKANEAKISDVASKYTYDSVISMELKKIGETIEQTKALFDGSPLGELQQEWQKRLQGGDKSLEETILKNINVIFGTLVGIASWGSFRNIQFDYVIVDEAGRATLPELAITLNKAAQFVLIGDHKQLPPVFEDEIINEGKIQGYTKEQILTTVFEELYEKLTQERPDYSHFLNRNYRMHSSIAHLISDMFYQGQIITENAELDQQKAHRLSSLKHHVYWYSTEKLDKRQDKSAGTSWNNRKNADEVKKLLLQMNQAYQLLDIRKTVGIISPYRSQSELLKQIIKAKSEDWTHLDIDIATVDAFQGSDRDIVVFDTVRSNPSNRLGHITDVKRLNVALSRAKELLLIVGDADCAYKGKFDDQKPNPYKQLVEIIRTTKDLYGFEKLTEHE
jgi:serine/threonine protein kinase/energy-coupling factor transporter ATP-binding protein EcfA2